MLHPSTRIPALHGIALLIVRLALGLILMAHGWQKFDEWTIAGTSQAFEDMGIPAPDVSAPLVAGAELIGGAALILGILTPLAALLNAIFMLGALVLVHAPAGLFVDQGGYELVLAIFAGLAVLTLQGGGRFSVDGLISRTRASTA